MSACEICGNQNDHPLEVSFRSAIHVFDSFECAVLGLASGCERCGCKFIAPVVGSLRLCERCADTASPVMYLPLRACRT